VYIYGIQIDFMYKIFLSVLFFITFSQIAFSQISGVLIDGKNNNKASLASVSLIRSEDSILLKSTRSNEQGQFNLNYTKNGNYDLLITHPYFGDRRMPIQLVNGKLNLGEINLTPRSVMLEEIFVKQKGSMKIKGDTTLYIADSFKLDVNANVEDLLKVLPGLEVDKDGNITAQGEQVQKILVDGEEFFGDDPTMATRNLQANIIDKVEVFDDKSEQAKFTGFDDGQKEKTVNLKLKKDKNKGIFGKLQGATDAQKFYDNSVMMNAFKNKRKLSVYGINSNTGTSGLSWSDKNNFGSGGNIESMDDGTMFSYDSDDEGGYGGRNGSQYSGEGFPTANNVGLHYSNKWQENKHHLNVNANNRNNALSLLNQSNTTQFIGPVTLVNSQGKITEKNNNNLSANAKYEVTIDSNTTVVLKVNGRINDTKNTTQNNAYNRNGFDTTSTTSNTNFSDGKNQSVGGEITLKKKLKKKGRTYSINTSTNFSTNKSDGSLVGNTNLRGEAIILDQKKNSDNSANQNNIRLVFTEPLKKDEVMLESSYNFGLSNSNQEKNTLVKNGSTNYNYRVDSLSNEFISNVTSHTPGIKIRFNQKKWNYGFGTSVRFAHFTQKDVIRDINYDYNQLNILPNASATYRISQQSNLRFNYSGSTSQPTIKQMQPFTDNTNPINIIIGNPNLKQSFEHYLNINWWSYKALKESHTYAGGYISQSFNEIVDSTNFDNITGRQITSYANINGQNGINFWSGHSGKIMKSDFKYDVGIGFNTNRNPTYVFGKKNIGNNVGINPNFELSYAKPKRYSISVKTNPSINIYSNKDLNQENNFWSNTFETYGSLNITKKLVFKTDFEYAWQQARPPFNTNFNRTIWNASIRHRFLKQNNLEAFISANDLLNNNIDYTRNTTANFINEDRNNSIRRYILVGAIWNFSFGPMSRMKDLVDEEDF
jgi:Outer membrane protein beta-barrel family